MSSRTFALALAFALAPTEVRGEEHVLLVGGGYRPEASQVQIELNVRWIQGLLEARKPSAKLETYFGGGARTEVLDVVEPAPFTSSTAEALARVFGPFEQGRLRFTHSRIERLSGSNEAAPIAARLRSLTRAMGPEDQLLFIYNGHGSGDPDDPAQNALRLWRDERLSAEELGRILDLAPASARVRLFFPQCFSGGFARVIRPGARAGRAVVEADRCGFFSQDELLEAEGCTASVDVGEYKDYSTYFFSALDRKSRSGSPLPRDPDRNRDGTVTLREAHLYALLAADSIDLPFSTSEAYLLDWRPWFARWRATRAEPTGEYQAVAEELGLALTGRRGKEALRAAIETRKAAEAARARLEAERTKGRVEIEALRSAIAARVEDRWPGALRPYTLAFEAFSGAGAAEAAAFIRGAPDYEALVIAQDRDERLKLEALAERRRASNVERYLRLRRLAETSELFMAIADADERARLERLVACEDTPL